MIFAALSLLWAPSGARANDVFAAPDVRVEVVGERWRIDVRGRILEVAVPKTDDERALISALVESLLADLRLPAPRAAPPPPSGLVPAAPPSPSPPRSPPVSPTPVRPRPEEGPAHAEPQNGPSPLPPSNARVVTPTVTEPAPVVRVPAAPSWNVWVAGSGTARMGVSPGFGPTVGLELGRRGGGRIRTTVDLPRATSFADDSSLSAFQIDAAAWWAFGPVRVEVGPGLSVRTFRREAGNLTRVPTPIGIAGVGAVARKGRVTIAPWIGGTLDAAVTIIDGDGSSDSVLSPMALWAELRVGWTP